MKTKHSIKHNLKY